MLRLLSPLKPALKEAWRLIQHPLCLKIYPGMLRQQKFMLFNIKENNIQVINNVFVCGGWAIAL